MIFSIFMTQQKHLGFKPSTSCTERQTPRPMAFQLVFIVSFVLFYLVLFCLHCILFCFGSVLFWSVGRSVGQSVRPSVRSFVRSVRSFNLSFNLSFNRSFFKSPIIFVIQIMCQVINITRLS